VLSGVRTWHRVQLDDGRRGFMSAQWNDVNSRYSPQTNADSIQSKK
jgi:hypothetical protein